jgi:hypothetical protein
MTFVTSWLAAARGSLGGHLRRLRSSLDTVAEQAREAVARAIGRTVADAVSEAVDSALAPAERRPDAYSPDRPTYPSRRASPLWNDPDESRWGRQDEDRDPYRRAHDDDPDPYADDPGEELAETPQPRRRRLGRALAAGLQAAAWWLNRHPGGLSVVVAVSLGLVAGTAALVRDTAVGPTGLVAAALGLLALDGLVRSGSDLAAQATTP